MNIPANAEEWFGLVLTFRPPCMLRYAGAVGTKIFTPLLCPPGPAPNSYFSNSCKVTSATKHVNGQSSHYVLICAL
jgi:hypothetical protein